MWRRSRSTPKSALADMDDPRQEYLNSLGITKPAVPSSASRAMDRIRPLIEGRTGSVQVPKDELLADPDLLASFQELEKVLPVLGLSLEQGPDGGGVIFDASYSPAKQQQPQPPAHEPAPAPAVSGGDPVAVQGQKPVNGARAKNLQPLPPSSGKGFLGELTKRAY